MLRIDNLQNDDIDSIDIFKPKDSKNCSPMKLYEDNYDKGSEDIKNNGTKRVAAVVVSILLIVGIIILIGIGYMIIREL